MQIAASFVEYLVTGCTSLLWIAPLLPESFTQDLNQRDKLIVLLVPILYVLGMLIDYGSLVVAEPFKKSIRRRQGARNSEADPRLKAIPSSRSFIFLHSPDLGKELQARSTRDRIARGACLNMLLLATVSALKRDGFGVAGPVVVSGAALALSVMAFGMWWRFEALTRSFRHDAVQTILDWATLAEGVPRTSIEK